MKQLDPKVVWLFFVSFLLRWLLLVIWIGFMVAIIFVDSRADDGNMKLAMLANLAPWAWLLLLGWVGGSYLWARLAYRFYRYELTPDAFRKELGVIWKKYVSIPYDRIQNVDIYRGPVARLLGLSDLHIQTAGMSNVGRYGRYGAFAEGRLPGLERDDAERLRDELIQRVRLAKDQGL